MELEKFELNSKEYTLNEVAGDIFEVMASNSKSYNCDLKGWGIDDLLDYVDTDFKDIKNIKELASFIINKAEELEEKFGTDNAIEIFEQSNISILKNNELKDLFSKIDKVSGEYDLEEPEPEVKKRNKLKP